MRDREVDDRHPQRDEHQPGPELHAVGDRTRDQGGGDDREHQPGTCTNAEDRDRVRTGPGRRPCRCRRSPHGEPGELARVFSRPTKSRPPSRPPPTSLPKAKRSRRAPTACRRAQRDEVHHHHVQDALATDHAAVEERQTWGHQHHQRGAGEHPCGVAGIEHGFPPAGQARLEGILGGAVFPRGRTLLRGGERLARSGLQAHYRGPLRDVDHALVTPAGRRRRPRARTAPGRRGPRRARRASPARRARAARGRRCRPWRCRRAWSGRCR